MSIREGWSIFFSYSENDLTPGIVNRLKEECFIQDLVLE